MGRPVRLGWAIIGTNHRKPILIEKKNDFGIFLSGRKCSVGGDMSKNRRTSLGNVCRVMAAGVLLPVMAFGT